MQKIMIRLLLNTPLNEKELELDTKIVNSNTEELPDYLQCDNSLFGKTAVLLPQEHTEKRYSLCVTYTKICDMDWIPDFDYL